MATSSSQNGYNGSSSHAGPSTLTHSDPALQTSHSHEGSLTGIKSSSGPSTSFQQVQLGSDPWFTYPPPSADEVEEDLPPYDEGESLPLGQMLERLTRRGNGELKTLLQQNLPLANGKQRARQVIDFARAQRQGTLKYLVLLRWKLAADIPTSSTSPGQSPTPVSRPAVVGVASFPTPLSNGGSSNTSPEASLGAFAPLIPNGKGKEKFIEDEKPEIPVIRGKITDTKRVVQFMEHQNRQQEQAIGHLQHVARMIELLRERNPDLLTAISLHNTGTYDQLPKSFSTDYLPRSPLSNRKILRTLRKLNRHLLYRLQCVDLVPPGLILEMVKDGRVYFVGGGRHGWKVQLTTVGFGEGDEDGRWWMTGFEWDRGVDDPGGTGDGKLMGEERRQVLDTVNDQILPPLPVEQPSKDPPGLGERSHSRQASHTSRVVEQSDVTPLLPDIDVDRKLDAPLFRLYNFLQYMSLSHQIHNLFTQATTMMQGRWRGQLQAQMDQDRKVLQAYYWIRQRPVQPSQSNVNRPATDGPRVLIYGGQLKVSIAETDKMSAMDETMLDVVSAGRRPSERLLALGLKIEWTIGEAGIGGKLKDGDVMDVSELQEGLADLSFKSILEAAARSHAANLLIHHVQPIVNSSRLTIFPLNPPKFTDTNTGLTFRVPLPSKQKDIAIVSAVSTLTGLIEITDEGGTETRTTRARIATTNINESKSKILDDIARLISAAVTETTEYQMRQLGWSPLRRLPVRYNDLPKNDLFLASSIFVPLPTSSRYYFVAKITPGGVFFELLRLAQVPAEGAGIKLTIGDRTPLDLPRLRARRAGHQMTAPLGALPVTIAQDGGENAPGSGFEIENKDLRDLFIFGNALVAQTTVEQQLKDRSVPYFIQYPPSSGPGAPTSSSAVAGMVPTLCVLAKDLLRGGNVTDVAMPKVFMQIKNWWTGGRCQVVTVVQLQHRSSGSKSSGTSPLSVPVPSVARDTDGIDFDPVNSIVRFKAEDINRCVASFTEQWERFSKVIAVAGEVHRLNKTEDFKDLEMISFDLRTATFTYSLGFSAAITYSPNDDSYQVVFAADDGDNPHDALAAPLTAKLNSLMLRQGQGSSPLKQFCMLLRQTLPFLLESQDLSAKAGSDVELYCKSVKEYVLIWKGAGGASHSVDVFLIYPNRFSIRDSTYVKRKNSPDQPSPPPTPIPDIKAIVSRIFEGLREKYGGGPMMAVKVDLEEAIICDERVVREVLRGLVGPQPGAQR